MANINQGVLDGLRRLGAKVRQLTVDGGLPGAPLGVRFLGATTSGAPATGTWKAGDHVEDRTGKIWICTTAGTPGTWMSGLGLLATTGLNGYTLVNGTGNIVSWTAPNDGALHRILLVVQLAVSSTETGGQVNVTFTAPNGSAETATIFPGNKGAGVAAASYTVFFIEANTAFTLTQASDLTGGASVLWAELWGS
jgi:hypothetical protein